MAEPTSVMNLQPNREPSEEIALMMGIGFAVYDEPQETSNITIIVAANN